VNAEASHHVNPNIQIFNKEKVGVEERKKQTPLYLKDARVTREKLQ